MIPLKAEGGLCRLFRLEGGGHVRCDVADRVLLDKTTSGQEIATQANRIYHAHEADSLIQIVPRT